MGTSPKFADTLLQGAALLGTRDTSAIGTALTAPSNVSTIVSGGSSGGKVEEIVVSGTATTAAGVVNVFLYDGSTYHLYDQIPVTAVTPSSTAVGFRAYRQYTNLFVKNGWSLRASHTCGASTNDSVLKVSAVGGDI